MLFLVTALAAILTGIFLFYFEITQCKNYFDTNLVKIHQAIIEILSVSRSVLYLVTANDGHLGMPNCKKKKNGFIAGRPKAALLFWFLIVVLLTICLWSASIVATCIAANFALCRDF